MNRGHISTLSDSDSDGSDSEDTPSSKILYLIRHGQSQYNVHYDVTFEDPMIWDAPLTDLGKEQSIQIQNSLKGIQLDAILSSPLSRALQTTLLGLPREKHTNAQYFVRSELREHLEASCDIGTPTSKLKKIYSQFDFSKLEEIWWYIGEADIDSVEDSHTHFETYGLYETWDSVHSRMDQIVSWITSLNENITHVALVGHGDFFNLFLDKYFGQEVWMKNSEVVVVNLPK